VSTQYELGLACDLRPDIPHPVLDTLASMVGSAAVPAATLPDDPFFRECDWRRLFRNGGAFPGLTGSTLQRAYRYHRPAAQGGDPVFRYTLSCHVGCNDDVVAHDLFGFLRWLAPWSETVGCVGYYRPYLRQQVEAPTLLYFRAGRVLVLAVTGSPVDLATGRP
jgi:hypothetical protein